VVDDRLAKVELKLTRSSAGARVTFRIKNLALGCEDGTVQTLYPKPLDIAVRPGQNFVADRWRVGSDARPETYLKVKGRLSKSWDHASGYIFAYVNPLDPVATDVQPECSTQGDAPWRASSG
jgi:hypothetical protein